MVLPIMVLPKGDKNYCWFIYSGRPGIKKLYCFFVLFVGSVVKKWNIFLFQKYFAG